MGYLKVRNAKMSTIDDPYDWICEFWRHTMRILLDVVACVLHVACFWVLSEGHGRLMEPPSRSSMWRLGYDTPVNYADNQLFCGGYSVSKNFVSLIEIV